MRRFEDSTFLFISTNPSHGDEGVEHLWLAVMRELRKRGATVRFLCLPGSSTAPAAREAGIDVDPYVLGRFNLLGSRRRLRHYIARYQPVCAHSTGLEADFLLRWAGNRIESLRIVHTLTAVSQATTRRRPVEALMRRIDERGMRSGADSVVVDTLELAAEVRSAGLAESRIVLDERHESDDKSVARHIAIYRRFMADRGPGR